MTPEKPEPPSYDEVTAENAALRARIAALEAEAARPSAPAPVRKFQPRTLDPTAKDAFQRPAATRRRTL